MNPKQIKALQALLTQPTKAAAAKEAGIDESTLRRYLSDPEFQKEYKAAFSQLVTDATRQAQKSLSPALSALREIVEDEKESAGSQTRYGRSSGEVEAEYLKLFEEAPALIGPDLDDSVIGRRKI